MDLKYLVTDMDGVVFDRMSLYKAVFESCLEQYISRELAGNFYYNTLGMPLRSQMKGVLSLTGIDAPEVMIDGLIKKYWETIGDNETKLFPGVKEVWDELKSRGIGFCASSGSNTGELGQLIGKFKLPYDIWLGSDKFHKGDEHIKIFARSYSVGTDDFCRQAAFLGDGTVDMEIAARNKIFGIGITNTLPGEKLAQAGARAVIKNIRDLPRVIENIDHGKF